ncbi:MAG: hypothetical protein VW239_08865 [Candidatus Nanopelagicales bacterium]
MAISINWGTRVIYVPQADLTPLGGSTYELDVDAFRLALKDLEDDEEGIPFPATHNHVAPISVGGISLARVVEIINDYTVEFEDGQYGVNVVGANSNIADVLVRNQVSVGTANSGGLIVSSGVDQANVQAALDAQGYTSARAANLDNLDEAVTAVAAEVWTQIVDGTITAAQAVRLMNAMLGGKVSGAGSGTEVFRDPADTKDRVTVTADAQGNRTAVVRDLT